MLFFLSILLSSTLAFSVTTVENLCGNSNPKSLVTSPLAKQSKYEWCFGGVCEENGKTFEREKCVKQMSEGEDIYHENSMIVSHSELHREPNRLSSKSYAGFYRLYSGDACFEECRPEEKSFLGINTGKKLGLEKEECIKCMIKLPPTNPDSFEVKGHGVTVYQGQKCHTLCRLPSGPYTDDRPYSEECLNCIGQMGIKPKTEHLMTKDGSCFEFRDGRYRGVSQVPERFCHEDPDVYSTYYTKTSKFSAASLFFKKPQDCLEVDAKSGGNYYKRIVDMINCDPEAANDNERANQKETPSSAPKENTSGARRN